VLVRAFPRPRAGIFESNNTTGFDGARTPEMDEEQASGGESAARRRPRSCFAWKPVARRGMRTRRTIFHLPGPARNELPDGRARRVCFTSRDAKPGGPSGGATVLGQGDGVGVVTAAGEQPRDERV